DESRHRANRKFHLPFEDEPELRTGYVQVALVAGHWGRLSLRIAAKNIRNADVYIVAVVRVADELRGVLLRLLLARDRQVVVDVRHVGFVVGPFAVGDARLLLPYSSSGWRGLIGRVHRLGRGPQH